MAADTDAGDAWAGIRLVVFDFDGVMTDNSVYVSADGTEQVRCWRGDGIGLTALREIGVDSFVLSTERDPVVAVRCAKLGVECRHGLADKAAALVELVDSRDLDWTQVAYVGNDVNDRGCLELAGLPIVVADAHNDVVGIAGYVTAAAGGYGAVREVCDLVVSAYATPERRG